MKNWFPSLVILCLCISLSACAATSGAPTTWLDQPLDGAHLPLSPLIIQTHASDEEGLSRFEFFIDDDLIGTVDAEGRFSEASLEWYPPAAGSYLVRVHAIDEQGNVGADATSLITIGEVSATITQPLMITAVTTVQISPTLTLSMTTSTVIPSTVTLTPISPSPTTSNAPEAVAVQNVNCRAGPSTMYESVGFLLQGQAAPILARNEAGDWFQITPPGKTFKCWVSLVAVSLSGDVASLPIVAAPPPPQPTTTTLPPAATTTPSLIILPPLPIDTTPPTISFPQASPTLILTQGLSCPTYARTTTVSAIVSDAGGVGSVKAQWNVGPESGATLMTPSGGGVYTAIIGPVNSAGNLEIMVYASDVAGNTAQAGPVVVQVQNCIE